MHTTAPKKKVHDWINDRAQNRKPLPDQKQLRRELGFELIEQQRNKRYRG